MFYNCLILLDFVWQLLLFIILLLLLINIFRLFFIFSPLNWNHPPILAKDHVTSFTNHKSNGAWCFHFSRPAFVAFPVPPSFFFFSMVWASPTYDELNKLHMFLLLLLAHFSRFSLHVIVFITSWVRKIKGLKIFEWFGVFRSVYFVKIEKFLLKVL